MSNGKGAGAHMSNGKGAGAHMSNGKGAGAHMSNGKGAAAHTPSLPRPCPTPHLHNDVTALHSCLLKRAALWNGGDIDTKL